MDYTGRLKADEWEVRPVQLDIGRRLVEAHHYARGASNTATYLHGLFERGELWDDMCRGVAWWIPPTKSAALATFPDNWKGVLSLSRLVIAPGTPKNACTFLLSRSMRLIDRGKWPCLVTYADEWQGHTGTIYRAANWKEAGMTKPEATFTLNGRMVSRKAGPKTRTREQMTHLGAEMVGKFAKRKFVHIAAKKTGGRWNEEEVLALCK